MGVRSYKCEQSMQNYLLENNCRVITRKAIFS
uniref:Uncharacterized protein n=1 Tax=Rhizophora mucronata TaxID=61149 RepID=A0A2P2N4C1_RHIMU